MNSRHFDMYLGDYRYTEKDIRVKNDNIIVEI